MIDDRRVTRLQTGRLWVWDSISDVEKLPPLHSVQINPWSLPDSTLVAKYDVCSEGKAVGA
jgi:hypothetical protein